MYLLPGVTIQPNLELKTRPKPVLGSLPLAFVLPGKRCQGTLHSFKKIAILSPSFSLSLSLSLPLSHTLSLPPSFSLSLPTSLFLSFSLSLSLSLWLRTHFTGQRERERERELHAHVPHSVSCTLKQKVRRALSVPHSVSLSACVIIIFYYINCNPSLCAISWRVFLSNTTWWI